MALRAFLSIALLLAPLVAYADSQIPERPPQVLQDPKTKVIYYLESDGRHVSAISPDGKLLWCCEVLPTPKNDFQKAFSIGGMSDGGDDIHFGVWRGNSGVGKINKTTGIYSPPTVTQ